jgi:predicted metalloprotease with PDZ domain
MPKMSNLWMYEGVTEYFANLFQINQGLITEDEFYLPEFQKRLKEQNNERQYVLHNNERKCDTTIQRPIRKCLPKGALIGMCLDIIIREKSNGKRILDLMQKLSNEYGVSKPFNDDALFAKNNRFNLSGVGAFFQPYVSGTTPIPYDNYFQSRIIKIYNKSHQCFPKGTKNLTSR